jgi:transposase
MDVLYRCCAGLDVHKKTVVACVRRVSPGGQVDVQVRTFGTTTAQLLALGDWMADQGVERVAMESTGVYWKPVYYLLEDRFAVMLVNAQHIKQVPGRKTDIKDCQWIAELLQYGLLRPSFVPPRPIRELRDLTRQRSQLVAERARAVNRVQKVLEDANIKLASVAADVLGVSGRAMIRCLIAGQDDPRRLAELARGRMRSKIPALEQALHGRINEHHRFLLAGLLDQIEFLESLIGRFDARVAKVIAPYSDAVERLRTIPGVDQRAAEVILAEIGPEMTIFPTAGHLCSWAGMCPGNNESAGKRRSGRTTPGSRWLRSVLVQAAWAASHTKKTSLAAAYRRRARRLGKRRSLVALGHKILVIVYELLSHGIDYVEQQPQPRQVA